MNNNIREDFVRLVYERIKNSITGADIDLIYVDKPKSRFFAGTLCTRNPQATPGDIRTKVAPVKMGVEFLLEKNNLKDAKVNITPSFSIYYKIFPDYDEQIESLMLKHDCDRKEALSLIDKFSVDPQKDLTESTKMRFVWRKHTPKPIEVSFCPDEVGDKKIINFQQIETMIEECKNTWKNDKKKYVSKRTKTAEMESFVPLTSLQNSEAFNEFINEWGEKEQKPNWSVGLQARIYDFDKDHIKISITLENTGTNPGNDHIDNYLFNTNLDITVEGTKVKDYIIDYLDDHYRYDGTMGAIGINCEAILTPDKKNIYSENVPSFFQMRTKNRKSVNPKFEDLASDNAIKKLKEVAQAMKDYVPQYEMGRKKIEAKSEIGRKRYEEDIKDFHNEIKRFEQGIHILETHNDALRAFKLMNHSFKKSSESKANDKNYDSWRTFQIVFIVMNIPDVVSTEHDIQNQIEEAEVLYFPTGGGKTETYLGLAVFTLFFDRIRGKKFGVSVLTKFPLRLLSLQQIQRTADIIANAELVKREEKLQGDRFSLGYYVGKNNTPNKLMDKGSLFGGQDLDVLSPVIDLRKKIQNGEIKEKDITNDEVMKSRKHLIITKCPFCGSEKIIIDGNKDQVRLMHRCLNEDCPWPKDEDLPIYVSDIEVYRYLPSIIISTLDKIAICGYQKNFRNLFGCVKAKCPKHGYSSTNECTEKYLCNVPKEDIELINIHDGVPTLIVQDELHLVRESLGTYDSHYESFIEHYSRELTNGRRSVKILAATATISEYRIQTNHLYNRHASRFPSQGPTIKESFYSKLDEDDLGRLIMGITPHDKTIIFSVLDVIHYYHEIIQEYIKNPDRLIEDLDLKAVSYEEIAKMLLDYKTMLSYHIAKSDGDSISNSIGTMVNRSLRQKKIREITRVPMTGDVSFSDVRHTLEELENTHNSDDAWLINATNMISHGVDLEMLNFMVFMGMPHNTAEYIQASSRIGRKYPGIVIIVFNPTRERDQSYFKFFNKYHEYRDLLVEAVPINRWAKFSVKRTLPGLYSAVIMNYFDLNQTSSDRTINMSSAFKKAYDSGELKEEEISDFLKRSYKVSEDPISQGFGDIIDQKVEVYTDAINDSLSNKFIAMIMPDAPMRSLRDVDELIDVGLTFEGRRALDDIGVERTSFYDEEDEEEIEVDTE